MRIIIIWVVNALVLMLVAYLVPNITVLNFYTALITALVLGLVNALIRPVLLLLTLPINLLTLGLFTLIINGLMFWLVSTIVKGFEVSGFWPAFVGALLFSLFTTIINMLAPKKVNE